MVTFESLGTVSYLPMVLYSIGHSPAYISDLLTSAADVQDDPPSEVPNGEPWRFRRATDKSEVRRQSILCRSSTSV